MRQVKLADLLTALPDARVRGSTATGIAGITYDSRRVEPGFLFVCIRGEKFDGHAFIPQAAARGAAAVVTERDVELPPGVTGIRTEDTRRAAAILADAFYGHPSRALRVVGVTGTSGKTTTTYLTEAVLAADGHRVGLIGTIKTKIGAKELPAEHTTPESIDLQSLCREMADDGADYLVMEVSSHSLELHRVQGLEFDVGVFTNLSREHLDFHQNMDDYLQAKAKLFRALGGGSHTPGKGAKRAVVNIDDAAGTAIMAAAAVPVLTYGVRGKADIRAEEVRVAGGGVSYRAVTPQGSIPVQLKITGLFNVYNSLAAIGVGIAEGVPLPAIKAALEAFAGVPGRFELVDAGQDFTVIVDYAHKPDGLENILNTAHEFAKARIIVVFGCGGDRDRTKRPVMGEIAAKLSDFCIVTSDNPRSEDPTAIIAAIEAGVRKVTDKYAVEPDRRKAIERAITMAKTGDVVIIAGKGHETYQILSDRTIHFDDKEEARVVLRRLGR